MAISRCFLLSGRRPLSSCSYLLSCSSLVNPFSPPSPPNPIIPITRPTVLPSSLISRSAISIHPPHNTLILFQFYTSSSDPPQSINCNSKLVSFSLSDSDSEALINQECKKELPSLLEYIERSSQKGMASMELELYWKKKEQERGCYLNDKAKLPPPFVPFKKPNEPPSLQELYKRKPSSQLGMTPEELELYRKKKDTACAVTEVEFRNVLIEAKKNPRYAVKEFRRMLTDGVAPNANTYAVLIKKLADDGDEKMLKEAKKSLLEMVEKGMKPSVMAYTDMFETLVRGGKEAEAREMAEMMKGKGFEFDEKGLRELLKWKIKIGDVTARDVISILFGR